MSFTYLGSPYTGSPEIMEVRYEAVLQATKWLLEKRIWVYSPIIHCHELAKRFNLPRDAAFWRDYNRAMLSSASTFLILSLPGWADSVGLQAEIDIATDLKMPVMFMSLPPQSVGVYHVYQEDRS